MERGGIAGLARRLFPLTARGLAALLIAAALLALGAIRADLAALFWGASFLLFTAYALVAGHLFRWGLSRRRSSAPDFLSLVLPAAGVPVGEPVEALATARLPRSFPPGFSVRLFLPLTWRERRIAAFSVRLPPRESRRRIVFTAEHRGRYTCDAARLEARDVLGFTAHRLDVPQSESLTVVPAVTAVEELSRLMEQEDESAVYAQRRRRSETLLEVRKYFPGDDIRRLNWKVFAHINELFLRVGEEVPPPESRILFVLDATANPLVPRAISADYLDGLVRVCASFMAAVIARGADVLFGMPGEPTCRAFASETLPALLAELADAWWTDSPWAADPPHRSLHVAVFSSPGSPGLPGIMTAAKRRGWKTSIFLKGLDPQPPANHLGLKGLIFLPAQRADRTLAANKRQRKSFEEAMARDLSLYAAGKALHAAEV